MRKIAAVIAAVLLMLCVLSACSGKKGQPATPGSLETMDGHSLHESTGRTDVSGEYTKQLCRGAWLDTDSLQYYVLKADGSYVRMEDETLSKQLGQGSWAVYRDDQQCLTLCIQESGAAAAKELAELELYDTSIYAYGAQGESYVWLLADQDA